MDKRTCSVEGCAKHHAARGWCMTHYKQWRMTPAAEALVRSRQEADKTCSVSGCQDRARARGWCTFHYTRWKITGDPTTPTSRRRPSPGALCSFPACTNPLRKREWCGQHYNQWRRTGRTWELSPWSENVACPVCGDPTGVVPNYRQTCSPRCQALYQRHGGDVPNQVPCVRCAEQIPLVVGGKSRRRNASTLMCKRCRRDASKHAMTVQELARRDGTDCGICGDPVDMTLRRPEKMCASVDHVMPKARGGSDEPENCQLAHWLCNAIKRDRIPT